MTRCCFKPRMLATSNGFVQLIADGAPLEQRDVAERTALLLATRANHVEVARLLIEAGADVNAKDSDPRTRRSSMPAPRAATRSSKLDPGQRPHEPAGHQPLWRGSADTGGASWLIRRRCASCLPPDIDIDHVNDLGWTALMEAVILGDGGPVYQEIVGLLVDAGAKSIPDRDGNTPLDHARQRGYDEIAARIEAGPKR